MTLDRKKPTRDWLTQKYVVEGQPVHNIAAECGYSTDSVYRFLRQSNIIAHTRKEAAEKEKTVRSLKLLCCRCHKPFDGSEEQHPRWSRCPACKIAIKNASGSEFWISGGHDG